MPPIRKLESFSNPYIKHLAKLRDNSAYRREQNKVFVEGDKVIEELAAVMPFYKIAVKELGSIPPDIEAEEILLINDAIMSKLSSDASACIIGEAALPEESSFEGISSLLALDGVSDPGNLGTLFRTACAFGWEGIFLLPQCCDPFNDKSLRAAKGAAFKIPFGRGSWEDLEKLVEKLKLDPLCADLQGEAAEAYKGKNPLLIIGSEAHGLSPEARALCSPITIPMAPGTESLNAAVAGGILLYLLKPDQKAGS